MTVEPTSGPSTSVNEVLLAEPRGFCAGVDRAIEIVERALLRFGAPIYVRHEIVQIGRASCRERVYSSV